MDPEWDADVRESRRVRLCEVMPAVGSKLTYEYDFGDGWKHDLRCVAVRQPESLKHPVCLAGARACPPEDVGGRWGYAEFLAALADPAHEEHASYSTWIGRPFDSESFSVEMVNKALRKFR